LGSKAEEARIDLELGLGTGLLEGNCVGGLWLLLFQELEMASSSSLQSFTLQANKVSHNRFLF
jgi:hypothetical protein